MCGDLARRTLVDCYGSFLKGRRHYAALLVSSFLTPWPTKHHLTPCRLVRVCVAAAGGAPRGIGFKAFGQGGQRVNAVVLRTGSPKPAIVQPYRGLRVDDLTLPF